MASSSCAILTDFVVRASSRKTPPQSLILRLRLMTLRMRRVLMMRVTFRTLVAPVALTLVVVILMKTVVRTPLLQG